MYIFILQHTAHLSLQNPQHCRWVIAAKVYTQSSTHSTLIIFSYKVHNTQSSTLQISAYKIDSTQGSTLRSLPTKSTTLAGQYIKIYTYKVVHYQGSTLSLPAAMSTTPKLVNAGRVYIHNPCTVHTLHSLRISACNLCLRSTDHNFIEKYIAERL